MYHQRSPRCLGAARLAAALLWGSPAEAALGGVTPVLGMLQVFAEGAAARPAPCSRARIARAQGLAVSAVAEEMSRLKVPVSGSGNPRREQRASRCPDRCRRARHPRCERHRPPGTTVGEARARRRDWRRAFLWGPHRYADRDDDLRLRRQGGGLRTSLPAPVRR
jgi:hypothetical protein